MKLFLRGALVAVFGLTLFCTGSATVAAQGNPPPKTTPPGEWKFDGSQWQFQPGGAAIPPQQSPGTNPQLPPGGYPVYQPPKTTPIYPGSVPTYPQTYPSAPQQYSQPSVKVQIGIQPPVGINSGFPVPSGMVVVQSGPRWVVRFKKFSNEPWHHYAVYGSKSAAFNVATNLSQQGFWAAVTNKY